MAERNYLYFAYGSNMNIYRLTSRLGYTPKGIPITLPNYKLCFNKVADGRQHGYANVMPEEGSSVQGIGYFVRLKDIHKLDIFEGLGYHYTRKNITVCFSDMKTSASIYIACKKVTRTGLKPTPEYLKHLILGAYQFKLGKEYVKEVKEIAGRKS